MATSARLEELKRKFDENPRRYFAPLANEYRKLGDVAQAIALCRTHLPNQPGHISGHIVLAQALYEGRELAESRQIFEAALELDPENLIALRYLGDIAREQGKASAARGWYERVLEVDPRNEEIAQLLISLEGSADRPTSDDLTTRPTPVSVDVTTSLLEVARDLGGSEPFTPVIPDTGQLPIASDMFAAPLAEEPEAAPSEASSEGPVSQAEPLRFEAFEELEDAGVQAVDEAPEGRFDFTKPESHDLPDDPSDLAAHSDGELDDWFVQADLPPDDPFAPPATHGVADANYFPILSGMTPVTPMPAYDPIDMARPFGEARGSEPRAAAEPATAPNEEASDAVIESEPVDAAVEFSPPAQAFDDVVAESLTDIESSSVAPFEATEVPELESDFAIAEDEADLSEWETSDSLAVDAEPSIAGMESDPFVESEPSEDEDTFESIAAEAEAALDEGAAALPDDDVDPVLGSVPNFNYVSAEVESAVSDSIGGPNSGPDFTAFDERSEPVLADPLLGRTPDIDHAVSESLSEPFVTETMAELYLQQGFQQEALDIYRQLLARQPNDRTLIERVAALEHDTESLIVPEGTAEEVQLTSGAGTAISEADLQINTADLAISAADIEINAEDVRTSEEVPAQLVSARDFFGRFARREALVADHADLRSNAPVEFTAPEVGLQARIGGAASVSEGLTQLEPEDQNSGSLASLFAGEAVNGPDERAALDLSSAYAGASESTSARADGGELSLEQLFRDVPARAPDAVTSGGAIYSAASNADGGNSVGETAGRGPGDIEQFTAWLEELKKK